MAWGIVFRVVVWLLNGRKVQTAAVAAGQIANQSRHIKILFDVGSRTTGAIHRLQLTANVRREGIEMIVEELVVGELGIPWNHPDAKGRFGTTAMRGIMREIAELALRGGSRRVRINAIREGGSRPTNRGSRDGFDGLYEVITGADGPTLRLIH